VNLLKKLFCCLTLIGAVPVLSSAALPRAAGTSLQLTVQPAQQEYHAGEPMKIGFVLQNIGSGPLLLFQPDTIHEAWMGWEISCTVTCPNGQKVRLVPEIQTARGRMPQKANFRELLIGGMIVIPLPVTESASPDLNERWIGLLRIPKDREAWPEKALRRKYGIRGSFGFTSNGEEIFIALNDLGKDVFGQPGKYLLECRYVNPHGQIFDTNGRVLPLSAWTGTLTAASLLEILPE
jgi:hypothetical protein